MFEFICENTDERATLTEFVYKAIDDLPKLSTIELANYYVYLYNLDDTKLSSGGIDILCSLLVYISSLLDERPVPSEYQEIADSEGNIDFDGDTWHWVTLHLHLKNNNSLFNINPATSSNLPK